MTNRERSALCGAGCAPALAPWERPSHLQDGVQNLSLGGLLQGALWAPRMCIDYVIRWNRRRATIRSLQALNDHYLADIGLDRSQIVATVETRAQGGAGSV